MMSSIARYCLLLLIVCVGNTFAAEPQVQLGDKTFHVRIADTVEKRTRGLSGSEPLASDQGMLFIFPNDGRYAIWMKEMKFSLDILWIGRFGKVVHIEREVHPNTYPACSFIPGEPARYVLEILAGEGRGASVGDSVRFKNIPSHQGS